MVLIFGGLLVFAVGLFLGVSILGRVQPLTPLELTQACSVMSTDDVGVIVISVHRKGESVEACDLQEWGNSPPRKK